MFYTLSLLFLAWDATLCTLQSAWQSTGSVTGVFPPYVSYNWDITQSYMLLGLHVADGCREERLKLAISEEGGIRQEGPRSVLYTWQAQPLRHVDDSSGNSSFLADLPKWLRLPSLASRAVRAQWGCVSRGLRAGFQDTGLHRPWRLGAGMSRLQREVKGILTHIVPCKQNSDLCHDCSAVHWSPRYPRSITEYLRSTVHLSPDQTDPLRLIWRCVSNAFLQLKVSCRAILLHMYVCFSWPCSCLTAGLCSQYTQVRHISVISSVSKRKQQYHTLDTSKKRNMFF